MPFVPRPYLADVIAASSPHRSVRRIRLAGGDLGRWTSTGLPDEWVHLRTPTELRHRAELESPSRLYSVASHDPEHAQLTIDITVHSTGPAARWAGRAVVGDQVILSQPVGRHRRPDDAEWEIVIADHAGLPAASRIIAEAPAGLAITALLEVDDAAARFSLPSQASVHVGWLYRPDLRRTSALPAAVEQLSLPPGPGYVWVGAETGPTRTIRRTVRRRWGQAPDRYAIAGYWQQRDADYDRRYRSVADQVATLYGQQAGGTRPPEEVIDEVDDLLDRYHL